MHKKILQVLMLTTSLVGVRSPCLSMEDSETNRTNGSRTHANQEQGSLNPFLTGMQVQPSTNPFKTNSAYQEQGSLNPFFTNSAYQEQPSTNPFRPNSAYQEQGSLNPFKTNSTQQPPNPFENGFDPFGRNTYPQPVQAHSSSSIFTTNRTYPAQPVQAYSQELHDVHSKATLENPNEEERGEKTNTVREEDCLTEQSPINSSRTKQKSCCERVEDLHWGLSHWILGIAEYFFRCICCSDPRTSPAKYAIKESVESKYMVQTDCYYIACCLEMYGRSCDGFYDNPIAGIICCPLAATCHLCMLPFQCCFCSESTYVGYMAKRPTQVPYTSSSFSYSDNNSRTASNGSASEVDTNAANSWARQQSAARMDAEHREQREKIARENRQREEQQRREYQRQQQIQAEQRERERQQAIIKQRNRIF